LRAHDVDKQAAGFFTQTQQQSSCIIAASFFQNQALNILRQYQTRKKIGTRRKKQSAITDKLCSCEVKGAATALPSRLE
jgi:hypothetical protein